MEKSESGFHQFSKILSFTKIPRLSVDNFFQIAVTLFVRKDSELFMMYYISY